MEKVKVTVEVNSTFPGGGKLSREIEVEQLTNAAGTACILNGTAKVRITNLGAALGADASKLLVERELILGPSYDDTALRGRMTPVGKKTVADGTMRIEGRPLLLELNRHAMEINKALSACRESLWDEERHTVEAKQIAGFPAGSVVVHFCHSEADGWIEVWGDEAGHVFRSPKVGGQVGRLGWMTREDYDAAVAEADAETRDRAEAEKRSAIAAKARERALTTVAVPDDAVMAYRRYQGDEDAAWEDENEHAWSLIREYAPAIEAQGLARPGAAVIRRALRSEDMPVGEG
jgi:hypothetical protein